MTEKIELFKQQLGSIEEVLVPREENKQKIVKPSFTRKIVTIVGLKTTKSRFLPVSHEGYSTDTFIDKVELLGSSRAEFIGRKLKGIERRAHMTLFRELIEAKGGKKWEDVFNEAFGRLCYIPDKLCIACWNCSLFGGLEAGKGAAFSRIRYFDTYSLQPTEFAIAMEGSEEGMAVGNTVSEDLAQKRGSESYHQYEYVKAGVHFPFITIIENPTLLDIAGYIKAVKIADEHGYGKYSANHGKFDTTFLAVSTGYPCFSVLDMLSWSGPNADTNLITSKFQENAPEVTFETNIGIAITFWGSEMEILLRQLDHEFKVYYELLFRR